MIIPTETLRQLRSVRDDEEATLPPEDLAAFLHRAQDALPAIDTTADLWSPVQSIQSVGDEVEALHGVAGRASFVAALVADLAVSFAEGLSDSGMPDSVVGLYPDRLRKLATYLTTADLAGYWMGSDALLKDLRIAAGYSVPTGALDVDVYGEVGRRSGLKAIVTAREFRNGWRAFRIGGPPWYVIHSDSRYLEEFDEEGWNRCYVRIAELLSRNPSVRGMVGSSWFYDPQLLTISPRLGYLQANPLRNGAFLLRNGPGAVHTERATARSETRRRLVENGSYVPVCHSVIWPREQLIAWARSH